MTMTKLNVLMRVLTLLPFFLLLCSCDHSDSKPAEPTPAFKLAEPQRDALQKAKDLEAKMQQDAEDQRKVIELQTNPK